jgi:sugar transferase (PEP-CTERM/EpsH1 system associated)
MRDILFLAHRMPYPPDRGDKMRSFHILRYLATRHRVHLLTFAHDAADIAHGESLLPFVASMHVEMRPQNIARQLSALVTGRPLSVAAFGSATMQAAVDHVLATRAIDTIFAFSGQMAQFVPADGRFKFIMDFVDIDSAKFADYAESGEALLRPLFAREARLLADYERSVAGRADRSLLVSDPEASLFRARTRLRSDRIATLENGIDLDYYHPDASKAPPLDRGGGPLIVFTGQMDYLPNIDAVCAFARHVLPTVRKTVPSARFVIVGRKPARRVRSLAGPQVIVTGAVDDVRPWLAAADVVVAPLLVGRGIQNKVLEAMAMARPTVASPVAALGVDAEPGRDYLVAPVEAMASPLIELLSDPLAAAALGKAGRARVQARYAWDTRLTLLDHWIPR